MPSSSSQGRSLIYHKVASHFSRIRLSNEIRWVHKHWAHAKLFKMHTICLFNVWRYSQNVETKELTMPINVATSERSTSVSGWCLFVCWFDTIDIQICFPSIIWQLQSKPFSRWLTVGASAQPAQLIARTECKSKSRTWTAKIAFARCDSHTTKLLCEIVRFVVGEFFSFSLFRCCRLIDDSTFRAIKKINK